jgi:hypothetical protein
VTAAKGRAGTPLHPTPFYVGNPHVNDNKRHKLTASSVERRVPYCHPARSSTATHSLGHRNRPEPGPQARGAVVL